MPGAQPPAGIYRIRAGDRLSYAPYACLAAAGNPAATNYNSASFTILSRARAIYDDGTEDTFTFAPFASVSKTPGVTAQTGQLADHAAVKGGWLLEWDFDLAVGSQAPPVNALWVNGYISPGDLANNSWQKVLSGPLNEGTFPALGEFREMDDENYSVLWVFQGTVLEDATVGTHVCTLTITPNPGGAFELLYGQIIATGVATLSQSAYITDGFGNVVTTFFSASAAGTYNFPYTSATGAAVGPSRFIVRGAQTLVLSATTSTASDTQTFSCALRVRAAALPTAVLADNTGAPTITINTRVVM